MTLTTYFLYTAAVALLILTSGPTMLMCMTNAVNHGTRRALMSVAGSVTAVLGVMLLSAMGLGALLSASEAAFTSLKVMGAAYLIYLGIKTFRSEPRRLARRCPPPGVRPWHRSCVKAARCAGSTASPAACSP